VPGTAYLRLDARGTAPAHGSSGTGRSWKDNLYRCPLWLPVRGDLLERGEEEEAVPLQCPACLPACVYKHLVSSSNTCISLERCVCMQEAPVRPL
jgi:hypothetical protein